VTGVGIIGAGRLGQAMASTALRAGRAVVISNIRGPESLASVVSGAGVVKAANTLAAGVLASDPHEGGGQRVIVLSSDDADAKSDVIALFENAGFFTFDLGGLRSGGEIHQIRGPLAGLNLVRLP
jgi:8-hydroxy-5-deazaflavin:NADPH oxidoreductase